MLRSGKIELLAPARDFEAGRAAVDFGADALYIGGPAFGARAAAANSLDDIARLVDYARPFGVRVYAALNTLVYENELPEAERVARELIAAGVDALIVQDMAFLRMGLPPVELHASTQTHNITPERVTFLEACGFARVILERGLTLSKIRAIREATSVELEAFVHGAICVGHSGRCYLSRAFGARSGNRGDCSQPCRQTYDLIGGDGHNILTGKHLLSLRDLNLSERLGDLIAAGVTSLKIEGRLKDTSYVKNVVAFYRQALDDLGVTRPSWGTSTYDFQPDPARSFSRGFTPYYIDGPAAGAASFETPKALGALVGRVKEVGSGWFALESGEALAAGDGICFDGNGVNINRVEDDRIYPNRMEGIVPGIAVHRNHDHRFEASLKASRTRRLVDVAARVEISRESISLEIVGPFQRTSCVRCYMPAAEGRNKNSGPPLAATWRIETSFTPARSPDQALAAIETAVGKSGKMPFRVVSVAIDRAGDVPFVPVATLNELRREAMEQLLETLRLQKSERLLPVEQLAAPFPQQHVGPEENVVNSLAERFYRDHGVREITPGRDLAESMRGKEVMRTPYCLRREIGQCLRKGSTLPWPLKLRHGRQELKLEFDCERCEMKLICQ